MRDQHVNLKKFWQNWNVLIVCVFIKISIHSLTNTNYDFHRDEYLYLALANHLSWGYMEVPPLIALLGKIALSLGGTLFVVRLFPTIIGCIIIILMANMVQDLGGKKWAQFFACLALLLSPAFLRSNMLFQPVSFNQFFGFCPPSFLSGLYCCPVFFTAL
jgi:hypothetical protein